MKNILLIFAIFASFMAQGQGFVVLDGDLATDALDTTVTEYSNGWSQWSTHPPTPAHHPSCISDNVTIITHNNFKAGSANPRISSGGWDFTTSYKYIGINHIVLETASTHPIYYHFVSDQDYDAFVDDLAYNSSDGSHLSPDGLTWLNTCFTPQAFLEAQSNFDRSRGSTYFFGEATNTYISVVSNSSFRVAIGTLPYIVFESNDNIIDAYDRLQEVLALESWERDLIGLGFTLESQSPNVWVKDCNGRVVVRHYPSPNRISVGGVPNTGIVDVGPGLTAIRNHCN